MKPVSVLGSSAESHVETNVKPDMFILDMRGRIYSDGFGRTLSFPRDFSRRTPPNFVRYRRETTLASLDTLAIRAPPLAIVGNRGGGTRISAIEKKKKTLSRYTRTCLRDGYIIIYRPNRRVFKVNIFHLKPRLSTAICTILFHNIKRFIIRRRTRAAA